MRRAFAALGFEPVDVPLDAAALERRPAGAPHSWPVDGKANVVAMTGQPPPLFASTATTDASTFQLYGDTPAVCFGPLAENEPASTSASTCRR